MTLEQLRALLREKLTAVKAVREKALGAEGQEADLEALGTALKEIETIERKIELAEQEQAAQAKSSQLANQPTGTTATSRPEPKAREVKGDQALALVAASVIVGKGRGEHPMKILQDEGYGAFADDIMRDPKAKAVNTLVSAEGGILVPQAQVGGIVPLLRAQSTFLAAGPTPVQLINGQYKTARGASGATAGYIAEGALKPISTPTFDAIDMRSKKLAGIVPMTNEARMWTVGNLEAYIRDDLRNALALTMDLNAWLGTGAGASPLGILNKSGVQTHTPAPAFASPTAPTLAELDRLATGMILKMTTNNLFANNRWRWVMSYRTAMFLADIRNTGGDLAFPELEGVGAGGGAAVWKGFPVIITSQFPTNGGGTTDETTLALVDFTHVLFGEEEGITMKMSDQATLDTSGAGALVHLWQQNMFAILAEAMHDFGLRFSKAVVKATVRF